MNIKWVAEICIGASRELYDLENSCGNIYGKLYIKTSSNFLTAFPIRRCYGEGVLFSTHTSSLQRRQKETVLTDHHDLGSANCDCIADSATPVNEVKSTTTQTAATAEMGDDKGKVKKFMFSKETKHPLLQAV